MMLDSMLLSYFLTNYCLFGFGYSIYGFADSACFENLFLIERKKINIIILSILYTETDCYLQSMKLNALKYFLNTSKRIS